MYPVAETIKDAIGWVNQEAPGVLIVEGVGCTGKTTLIEAAAIELGVVGSSAPVQYRRWGHHKEWRWADRDPYKSGTHGSLFVMDYLTQANWRTGHPPVILDRAYPSSWAYNGACGLPQEMEFELADKRMELFVRLLDEIDAAARARIVLCRLPTGATLQYLLERRYEEFPHYKADPRWQAEFLEGIDARFQECFDRWLPNDSRVLQYQLRLPAETTHPFLGLREDSLDKGGSK